MKRNSCKLQNRRKKEKYRYFSAAYVYEARKVWASSECLNPYNAEYAYEQLNAYFSGGASNG